MENVLEVLHRNSEQFHPTGSRYIGGATTESDYDFVLLNPYLGGIEMELGVAFLLGGSGPTVAPFNSWKAYDGIITLNIIEVTDKVLYSRWVTTTEVAKGMEMHDKALRVAFFENMRTQEFPTEYDHSVPF